MPYMLFLDEKNFAPKRYPRMWEVPEPPIRRNSLSLHLAPETQEHKLEGPSTKFMNAFL